IVPGPFPPPPPAPVEPEPPQASCKRTATFTKSSKARDEVRGRTIGTLGSISSLIDDVMQEHGCILVACKGGNTATRWTSVSSAANASSGTQFGQGLWHITRENDPAAGQTKWPRRLHQTSTFNNLRLIPLPCLCGRSHGDEISCGADQGRASGDIHHRRHRF